jgi:hypothetical protein
LISSSLGTLPNSSCRATAILALRSFSSVSGLAYLYLFQNSLYLSSFDTLFIR